MKKALVGVLFFLTLVSSAFAQQQSFSFVQTDTVLGAQTNRGNIYGGVTPFSVYSGANGVGRHAMSLSSGIGGSADLNGFASSRNGFVSGQVGLSGMSNSFTDGRTSNTFTNLGVRVDTTSHGNSTVSGTGTMTGGGSVGRAVCCKG